ncbi:MAG TPA: hypothetical protein VG847_16835 [Chitinophagaceae bacterium]|nr:hypothetical protein [Chitinophagaceae bacterium]
MPLIFAVTLAISCFFSDPLFAQSPTIQTTVDKKNILIGEQLHLTVTTSMPDNTYRLAWFNIPDSFGNFKVVHENKIDSTNANGTLGFSQDITLTSFDSGRQVIPALTLNLETLQGDSSFNLVTDSIPVEVSYSPIDSSATFHDIKSIIDVKKQWEWWWWALLGVVLILLFFWIRFLIRFFRKKNQPDIFKSKLSPYDEAMQMLNELDKENLLEQNAVKEYHTRLTDIFRRYLSRKTKTNRMHQTTDELLMDIHDLNLNKEHVASFASALRIGSAVKFAKFIPAQNESESCLLQVRSMINEIHTVSDKKPESDT